MASSVCVHSTKGMAVSSTLFKGILAEDVYYTVNWASPHTFVK